MSKISQKDFTINKIWVNGAELNYARIGKGPALVFVHGWTNSWESWIPISKYLKKHYTLYLLDLPGFGDSSDLPQYSVRTAALYVDKFIQKMGLKPLSVVGLSMGSTITAEFGRSYSKSSKSIILMGPIAGIYKKSNNVARAIYYSLCFINNFSTTEEAVKRIIETRVASYAMAKFVNMYKFNKFLVDAYGIIGKRKMRKEAFTQMGISIFKYNLMQILKEYKKKTLLVYGAEDRVTTSEYAREVLLPNNKNLKFIDIPKAGHVVPLEKPKESANAIIKFLKAV